MSVRLRFLATSVVEPNLDDAAAYVGLEHVLPTESRLIPDWRCMSGPPTGLLTFRRGDVLYGKLRPALRKVLAADFSGAASSEFLVLRPTNRVDSRFLGYLLRSAAFAEFASASVFGAKMPRTSWGEVRDYACPVPSAARQVATVCFLDRECERISELDSAFSRLAPVLGEVALARFVELTRHRPLTRLGYQYGVQLGKMLDEGKASTGELVPYLRNQNVDWDGFDLDDVKLMPLTSAERSMYLVLPGDLLACEGRHVGKSAVWEGEISPMHFQKALHRIRPYRSWSTRYLMWCLWVGNVRGDFYADGTGSTIPHLPAEKLRAVRIPWAERAEQDEIVDEVDAIRRSAEAARRKASEVRARLSEYRDALITEAVTGALDVTGLSNAQLDESVHAALEGQTPEMLAS